MSCRILIIALLFAAPLYGGLWDTDRPEELPAAYDAIGGRFDDFPPAYYEARLERNLPKVEALADLEDDLTPEQIDAVAETLADFDDAAVAHFRAEQYAEAIILIDRKNRLLALIQHDRTATARNHRIRALANKAACLHHRWRQAESPDLADLNLARDLLDTLVQEDQYNSDARWSLLEIDWLLSHPGYVAGIDPVFPNLLGLNDAAFRGGLDDTAPARVGLGGCIPWLTRRIVYESAWRDVDVMYAFSLALYLTGRAEESLFAWFRVCELIDNGQSTRVANAPGPNTLKRLMGVHVENLPDREAARKLYAELRSRCDSWRESRHEYLVSQLAQGKHPDTDTDFWSGWSLNDKGPPVAGQAPPDEGVTVSPILLLGGFGGLILVLVLVLGATIFMSRKGTSPSVDEL